MAINNQPTIKPRTVTGLFTKYIPKVIPLAFDESMSYYECLCALLKYINETVMPDLNNVNEGLEELQNFYTELQSYVNNYFDNLDVQEEINNKLDAMVEDGTLDQIIEQYLNSSAIWGFNTVADMKLATNLINGSFAKTLGYYAINDGGSATYKIRTITNNDVIDEASIIALNDNTLVAELVPGEYITIYQFGAKGDNTTDDSTSIQKTINYSNNHNYIEVRGDQEKTSKISETIKLHAYSKVNSLSLDVISNSLTNNYMISVNSNNVSTWDTEYPNATKGSVKNIKLNNSLELTGINGIYNASNTQYENIETNKLNISFRNINSYLDVVQIYNIQIANKIGTDYAINMGYLGDSCKIDTAHIYGGDTPPNFLTGFSGHNAITLSNIIANGNVNINGGNVLINNLHSESGTITVNKANLTINNGFLYHSSDKIAITESYVILNQIIFVYRSLAFDYSSTTDIDINIDNKSTVEVNECYKNQLGLDINEKIYSFVKTNLDDQATFNPNKKYYRGGLKSNEIKTTIKAVSRSVSTPQASDKVKWYGETGTYYYKAVPIVDVERKLRINLYVSDETSISLTNGGNGFRFGAASSGMWRIYRGTTSGSYDKYVDIAISDTSIHDDGNFCNGYKWLDRTAGAVETFMTVPQDTTVEYNGENIKVFRNNIPDLGTWKRGDIVYNSATTETGSVGWICINGGSPGTWRSL